MSEWEDWPPSDGVDCVEVRLERGIVDRALRVDPAEHDGEEWLVIENIKRKKKLKPLQWRRFRGGGRMATSVDFGGASRRVGTE